MAEQSHTPYRGASTPVRVTPFEGDTDPLSVRPSMAAAQQQLRAKTCTLYLTPREEGFA